MTRVTPFLMFDDQLEAAIGFYVTTFPSRSLSTLEKAYAAAV